MSVAYKDFLASKHLRTHRTGFDVSPEKLNSHLKDWQRLICWWNLKAGRCADLLNCGLGKTILQLEYGYQIVKKTNKKVLILCPLAVGWQTVREAEKFGIGCDVKQVKEQGECVGPGIFVTNYEKLAHFDSKKFVGMVADECFPQGTPIDTLSGQVAIEKLRPGDIIYNAAGVDRIVAIKKRRITHATRITYDGGKKIYASANHPFFTARGYVRACELRPGEVLVATGTAMRLVREANSAQDSSRVFEAFLQQELLSELANEATQVHCTGSHRGNTEEAWRSEEALVSSRFGGSGIGACQDGSTQSDDRSESSGETESYTQADRSQAQHSRRQREAIAGGTEAFAGDLARWLGTRASHIAREETGRVSIELQGGPGECGIESIYRGRRPYASIEEVSRFEERHEAGFARVESVEILELGYPELDKFRDAEGQLYFYDLQAERHPSFSVDGLLVHNSGILKSYVGKTKRALCKAFEHTEYKLCCSATPAPNDRMELGNHSEFLGVMPSCEMLQRWFINDGGKAGSYRLRRHGEDSFWRWMASWSACLASPADIGFSDEGYKLPPLNVVEHVIESKPQEGYLFPIPKDVSATEVHQEKRANLEERVAKVAELVNADKDVWTVWCDTDYEADAIKKLIPDCLEIRGSHSEKFKEEGLQAFIDGKVRVLVSKSEICGFGLNLQHCHKTTWFAGFSYERWYQAISRMQRFGQKHQVDCHIVRTTNEQSIMEVVQRKQRNHEEMQREMPSRMREGMAEELGLGMRPVKYEAEKRIEVPNWLVSK